MTDGRKEGWTDMDKPISLHLWWGIKRLYGRLMFCKYNNANYNCKVLFNCTFYFYCICRRPGTRFLSFLLGQPTRTKSRIFLKALLSGNGLSSGFYGSWGKGPFVIVGQGEMPF